MSPYQESIAFIGEVVAQEMGFFREEGLEVNFLPSGGGSEAVQHVLAGNVQFGVSSAADVIIGASRDPTVRAIMQIDHGLVQIVVPEASSIRSIDDLAGRRLGITDEAGGEVPFVRAVLHDAGLTDQVALVVVGPGGPAVALALQQGRVDAYAGYSNDLAGVEAAGIDLRTITPPERRDLPTNVLFTLERHLQNPGSRDLIIRIARAWNRGVAFAAADPRRALELACRRIPEECEDRKTAQVFLEISIQGELAPAGQVQGFLDLRRLTIVHDDLLRSGDIQSPVDLSRVFTNELLSQINQRTHEEPA